MSKFIFNLSSRLCYFPCLLAVHKDTELVNESLLGREPFWWALPIHHKLAPHSLIKMPCPTEEFPRLAANGGTDYDSWLVIHNAYTIPDVFIFVKECFSSSIQVDKKESKRIIIFSSTDIEVVYNHLLPMGGNPEV